MRIDVGPGGLPRVTVTTQACRAEVMLHGAHLTAWEPAGCVPVIWLTGQARFAPGVPIRGGVPLCWPWFGPGAERSLPMHGPVRTLAWTLDDVRVDAEGTATITLSCADDAATRSVFPHAFRLRYTITAGRSLDLSLIATNTGASVIPVGEAMHTYLAVGDVRRVSLSGLEGTTYIDRSETHGFHLLAEHPRGVQAGPVTFTEEVDRHHLAHTGEVQLHDPAWGRVLRLSKRGSRSTQVWNPWIGKAQRLPDLGDHEWPAFVVAEAANAFDEAYVLEPGAQHELGMNIAVL